MKLPTSVNPKLKFCLILMFAVLSTWLFFNNRVSGVYAKLVSNQELIAAITEGDANRLTIVTQKLGIDFQVVEDSRITSSSATDLPTPTFFTIETRPSEKILRLPLDQELSQLQPHQLWLRNGYYLLVPVFPEQAGDGYLFYVRVIG